MIEVDERYIKFTGLIFEIGRAIQKIKKMEMANFGLKGKQVQCLFVLHEREKGATMSELADLCGEDKASISRTVHELEDQKFLKTDPKAEKKYKNLICLTAKGKKMAKIVYEKVSEISSQIGMGTSDTERRSLYRALTRISHNLNKMVEK